MVFQPVMIAWHANVPMKMLLMLNNELDQHCEETFVIVPAIHWSLVVSLGCVVHLGPCRQIRDSQTVQGSFRCCGGRPVLGDLSPGHPP